MTDTDTPKTDATRVAIECLTVWLEPGTRVAPAVYLSNLQHGPDGPGTDTVITGLLNLSTILVLQLAKQLGAPPELMMDKAHEILRHIAIDGMPPE